jgi:hypothetical protein
MDVMQLATILGVIAALIAIASFIKPKILEMWKRWKICPNFKYLKRKVNYDEPITQMTKIFAQTESTNKILSVRPQKIFQIEVHDPISDNRTVTFFSAKKRADDIARTCLKDSKFVHALLTSWDVFATANGEPYVKTYSWAYVYRTDKDFLLIHLGNDLKPIGHNHIWKETDEKKIIKYPPISDDDVRIDSDRAYEIANENDIFLDKGSLVLISVDTFVGILDDRYWNFLDRGSPYWVLKGRYFINSKTGKLFDGTDLEYELKGIPQHKITVNNTMYRAIAFKKTIKTTNPLQNITFNREIDLKKGNIISDNYERWQNIYEYHGWGDITGIPARARTIDKTNNQILAKIEINVNEKKFLEKHFSENGDVTYESSGTINPATGSKEKEHTIRGEKIIEYYHTLPVRKEF